MPKQVLFLFAALVISTSSHSQLPKGLTVESNAENSIGETWAVIVGVSAYQNISKLNFADKDAKAFYDYLLDKQLNLKSSNIKLLLNKQATAAEIYGALEWLQQSVKEKDRVIFYFSGHGDVEMKTIHQNGFLLAHDAPKASYMTMGTISVKFLQDYLETYIARNKVKEVILIVDACRSGKLAGGLNGIQITMQALGQNWNNRIVKILSAQEGELSLEDEKWGGGRGVFSYYLMKGIQGMANRNSDSLITIAELASYLPLVVADETKTAQNPKVEGTPNHVLFTFNSTQLAMARIEQTATDPASIVSRGFADELDNEVKEDYDKYKLFVSKGRLIWGSSEADTLASAINYYRKLLGKEKAKVIWPSLRSSFIAALQKKTQEKLDLYIKGKDYGFKPKDVEAYKEISIARSLMDTSNILYPYITARALFMEAVFSKNPRKSIQLLYKSLLAEPGAPHVFNKLGTHYSQINKIDSAIYYYHKASSVSPLWSYPFYNLGITYWEMKDFPKAILWSLKAIEMDTSNASPYNTLGSIYFDMENNADAMKYYQKAIALDPGFSYSYNGLGNVFAETGKSEEAIESYKMAIKLDPNDELPYNGIGRIYEERGQFDTAINFYEKSIEINPLNEFTYAHLGDAYFEMNELDSAMAFYYKTIKLDAAFIHALERLGDIYYSKHKYDSAKKYYSKIIELDPNNFDLLLKLGVIYQSGIKNYKLAKKYYLLALQANPSGLYLHLSIAEIASLSKDPKTSLVLLEKAITAGKTSYQSILESKDLKFTKSLKQFPALMKKYFAGQVK